MKGKLNKINGKWFVEYSTVSYTGGNPKILGSYSKKIEPKRLELTPNNQRYLNCFLQVDKDTRVKFKEVLINPMGREVDPNDLGQNHSGCVWYGKLIPEVEDEYQKPTQTTIDIKLISDSVLDKKEIKVEDVFNDEENDWEEILFDFIDFYPCILPHELFEWLEENYEIPKKKDGK